MDEELSPNTVFAANSGFFLWEDGEYDAAIGYYEYAARRCEKHGLFRYGHYLILNGDKETGICMIVLSALLKNEVALEWIPDDNVLNLISPKTIEEFATKSHSENDKFVKVTAINRISNRRERDILLALMDQILLVKLS